MGETNVMYFLSDFDKTASFGSREINVKAYTRIINGKAVPVKGARRTVLAIRDALDDLRKITRDNNEGAYLMNPRTGKVGQYVQGGKREVKSFANITTKGKRIPDKVVENRYVLHNHPSRNSLSGADLFSGKIGNNKTIFAINTTGSVFRAKSTSLKNRPTSLFTTSSILNFHEKTLENNLRSLIEPAMKNGVKDKQSMMFLATHLTNLQLQDSTLIKYRAKLTPVDKQLVDNNKELLDNLRKTFKEEYSRKFKRNI
jgi:hypothetical protein